MTLKEIYTDIEKGWYQFLDNLEQIDTALRGISSYIGINTINRFNGMMQIKFHPSSDEAVNFIQHAVAYRIERLSAKICEKCGRFGFRRTELTTVQTLCFDCYAIAYSDMYDKRSAQDV